MKKVFTLSTCDTSRKIIKQLHLQEKGFALHDIKQNSLTEADINDMVFLSGSYESLFSRRARQYIALRLKSKQLTEQDYKSLILSDYTFLKRPVIIYGNKIFIGNSMKNIMNAEKAIL